MAHTWGCRYRYMKGCRVINEMNSTWRFKEGPTRLPSLAAPAAAAATRRGRRFHPQHARPEGAAILHQPSVLPPLLLLLPPLPLAHALELHHAGCGAREPGEGGAQGV